MKKIVWLTLLLSTNLLLVGCGNNNNNVDNTTKKVQVLQATKQRENVVLPNETNTNKNEQTINNEEVEIEDTLPTEQELSPFLTYNYLSTTENKSTDIILKIEDYKDWLTFKNNNVELYTLFTNSPLQIDEDYFNKNILMIVNNKDFNLEKLFQFTTSKKVNNNLYFYVEQSQSIKDIDNYDVILENVPDFEEKITSQFLILAFTKKEMKEISSYQIVQE